MAQVGRGKDIQAGLETFDEAFFLDGIPEAELLSLLSDRSRAAIWNFIGDNKISFRGSKASCSVKEGEVHLDGKVYPHASHNLKWFSQMALPYIR